MLQFIGGTAAVAATNVLPLLWDMKRETHYAFRHYGTTPSIALQRRAALREAFPLIRASLLLIVPLRFSGVQSLGPLLRAHTGLVVHPSLLAPLAWESEV